jgi:hypothetical protein
MCLNLVRRQLTATNLNHYFQKSGCYLYIRRLLHSHEDQLFKNISKHKAQKKSKFVSSLYTMRTALRPVHQSSRPQTCFLITLKLHISIIISYNICNICNIEIEPLNTSRNFEHIRLVACLNS